MAKVVLGGTVKVIPAGKGTMTEVLLESEYTVPPILLTNVTLNALMSGLGIHDAGIVI